MVNIEMSDAEYQEWKDYAIMKAGEAQLKKIG